MSDVSIRHGLVAGPQLDKVESSPAGVDEALVALNSWLRGKPACAQAFMNSPTAPVQRGFAFY